MIETLLQNRTVQVLIESFPRILLPGLAVTIPLTVLSFAFAMVIAAAVALVQFARVPVLRQLARVYIWVVRGTPLLVQLFIIFYGLPSMGIVLDAWGCPGGRSCGGSSCRRRCAPPSRRCPTP